VLLNALSAGDPTLEAIVTLLSDTFDNATVRSRDVSRTWKSTEAPLQEWHEAELKIMDDRLQAMLRTHAPTHDVNQAQDIDMTSTSDSRVVGPQVDATMNLESGDSKMLGPGWRLLDERAGWRPAPMGVFVTCT
jgi:hypothetical protein